MHFLGNLPSDWGVNIASQLSYVNLIYEIISEALILPLFYLLGKAKDNREELENKAVVGLIISSGIYSILSVLIAVFAKQLCQLMASNPETIDATVSYIRLETIASALSIVVKFITLLLYELNKKTYCYILLFIQTIVSILLDILFISQLPISLDLGVNGIAYANIIVSMISIGIVFIMLYKSEIKIFSKRKLDFFWLKEYGKIGLYSGLESFVRNIAYMLMVSRLVNVISEQGTYWVANSFIWTWLLLPANALYEVVKIETGKDKENIRTKTKAYFLVATIFSLLWVVSIPCWNFFVKDILNASDGETVIYVTLVQTGFYIIYIYNCVMDGTIYGRGKTNYMLVESILTNGIYYVIMFIRYITNSWTPTLLTISLMFGIGMAFDFIPTLGCYIYLIKKEIKTR